MDRLSPWERIFLTRILPLLVFVLFVATIGLVVLVQRNSHNNDQLTISVDRTSISVDKMSDAVTKVERSVDHLETFVNELETETPSEQQRNAAITKAVQEVPQIKDILCGEFPEATACRQ